LEDSTTIEDEDTLKNDPTVTSKNYLFSTPEQTALLAQIPLIIKTHTGDIPITI